MAELTLIKVGGALVEDPVALETLLDGVSALPGAKVVVHGGGRSATALAGELGIPTRMVSGRRVTDERMLDVVTMVYAGRVNKRIVAGLQRRGVMALGMTGADLGCIRAVRRPPVEMDGKTVDFGFVGDVTRVDGERLLALCRTGIVPVLAPLCWDGADGLLNTNADTIASQTARYLQAAAGDAAPVTLRYVFEEEGVRDGDRVLERISREQFSAMVRSGAVYGGMVPKLENAFAAAEAGIGEVYICSYRHLDGGTRIIREDTL